MAYIDIAVGFRTRLVGVFYKRKTLHCKSGGPVTNFFMNTIRLFCLSNVSNGIFLFLNKMISKVKW